MDDFFDPHLLWLFNLFWLLTDMSGRSKVVDGEAIRDERAKYANGPIFDENELRRKYCNA